MKEFEKQAIKDLIEFYKLYLQDANKANLTNKAEEIQSKYISGSPLLNIETYNLIAGLVDFYVDTGISPPSKEEVKKVIEKLQKQESELAKK